MADNKQTKREIVTPEFRISFPALFRPAAMEGSEPKFGLTMLFPVSASAALEPLRQRVKDVVAIKWTDAKSRPPKLRNPLRDGNEKTHIDGYKDCIFAKATSKTRPRIVGPDMQDIIDETKVYAGSYARAVVEAYAYNRNGNAGVALSLIMLQWLRDGEPFGRSYGEPDEYFSAADTPPNSGDFF